MCRNLLTIAFVMMSMSCFGQVFRFQQFCQTGAQNVITQGLNSTTHVQRSYPSCTVAVYLTGTTTLATIYSDALSTPLANPFTANTDGSFGFWAAPATTPSGCYDVTISGGNPGDQLGAPFTFADVCLGIGSGGGGSGVSCPLAVAGAIGAFTSPTGFSCDPNFKTDFQGNFTAISGTFVGPVNGFFTLIGGTSDPGTQAKYKLPNNAFRWLAAASGSSFYGRVPSTHCTPGQVWQVLSNSTDPNGDTIDNMSCLTPSNGQIIQVNGTPITTESPANFQNGTNIAITNPSAGNIVISASGGGVEAQTNGVDNANCTGGPPCIAPLINAQSGLGVTVTNPSGGIWNYALTDATQIATPTAPTLTVNGVTGATTITYKIVACEDVTCNHATVASPTTSVTNANATLSSSNSITLSGYGDTLYAPRCFDIYRTAAGGTPSTTGRIAHCVGKKFVDTGLAGNGASSPATNNTILVFNSAALPGCNIPPFDIIGPDAPPCTPNAVDDEMRQTFGAPGDVNNPFYTWINQQAGVTATWSSGTIVLTSDTGGQYSALSFAAPGSSPYTFVAYVDSHGINTGDGCGIGYRESSTGKIAILELVNNGASGTVFQALNGTLASVGGAGSWSFRQQGAWLAIQNTGTAINYLYSLDGIAYQQLGTQPIGTPFTTGPNQFFLGTRGLTTTTVCVFDFERRTQ